MKNIFRTIIFTLGVILVLASCKEEKLHRYDSSSDVYFQHRVPSPFVGLQYAGYRAEMPYEGKTLKVNLKAANREPLDSLEVAMYMVPESNSHIVFIPVALMGNPVGRDRKIAYEIVAPQGLEPDVVAAKESEGHFRVLDALIPKDSTVGGIVIELNRNKLAYEDQYAVIDFRLVANDNFTTNFAWVDKSANDDEQMSTLVMRLKYTDGLGYPPFKQIMELYVGDWSSRKAMVFNEHLGYSLDFLYTDLSTEMTLGAMAVMGQRLQGWLNDYYSDNGVHYEEADGEAMRSGDAYPVDGLIYN